MSPLTDPVSVGAILFSALNCEQTFSVFPFSLNFSRRSHPVTVVGEADGDDDEDEDRDDGHHHHVGGEQSCQVIWCSAEKKTVNNMKSYTQQACNIEKSLSMNEKGKYKNNPKSHIAEVENNKETAKPPQRIKNGTFLNPESPSPQSIVHHAVTNTSMFCRTQR